jgi:hypothetical protein
MEEHGTTPPHHFQYLFTVFTNANQVRLDVVDEYNKIQGSVMEINKASSSTVRRKTAEGIFAVVDEGAVWAASAKTDLSRESAMWAHLPESSSEGDTTAKVRLTQRHARADVGILYHPREFFKANLPISIQIRLHDRLVHNLLQLHVLEIAAHHHLQHDE